MMRCLFVCILALTGSEVAGQLNPLVISIPMRDGKTLAADLHLPSDTGSYPVILIQTPYNKNLFRLGLPVGIGINITSSPYAVVVLDWRCFYASTNACALDATRGEDGFDAIEWIAAQLWCNGKIGTWGPSALGNVQFNTAREQPPHLVCAVPVVASPQFSYTQYYPGGVALPEYLETLGGLFGDAFILVKQNPYYNVIWQIAESSTFFPDEITVPMLHVGGWFDHNTEGVLTWFHAMRAVSPAADEQWLLMGPWTHGGAGFSGVGTAIQGELSFPEAAGYHNIFARAFFDYYLLEAANGWEQTPPVSYFQMGENVWRTSETFPPSTSTNTETLYLRGDHSLRFELSDTATSFTYLYDPTDPSPTVGGKTLSDELDQGPYDQAIVEARNDNVIFTSAELTSDLVTEGRIKVNLFVSSDRPDTDYHLRITEVYPDGRSVALGQIAQRMRFRDGYRLNDESFMSPGEVYEIEMQFDHLAHTFRAGSRVRLIISSSNHIWYNRNMNNGAEMYPNTHLDTLVQPVIAANSVHVQGPHLSRIMIPNSGLQSTIHEHPSPQFKLFPNPAASTIILKHVEAGARIEVISLSGQVELQLMTTQASQCIDVSQFLPGVYLVSVKQGAMSSTMPLIVIGQH